MDVSRKRDLVSLGMVATSVAAVALANPGSLPGVVVFSVVSTWAYLRPAKPESGLTWTVIIATALAASVARILKFEDILDSAIDFLLLLVVQRFIHRITTRAHIQLGLLAALLMMIAAVLNTSISYPLLLALFLPLLTLSLILNHFLGQAEQQGARAQFDSEITLRKHWPRLIRTAMTVSLALAAVGIGVFLFFPRMGVGAFLRGQKAAGNVSGFANQVELGNFGTIRDDPTIALRIFPRDAVSAARLKTMHWRGVAFDRYRNGSWSHGPDAWRTPVSQRRGDFQFGIPFARHGKATEASQRFAATIVSEDFGAEALMLPSRPTGLRPLPRGLLEKRVSLIGAVDHQVLALSRPPGSFAYEAKADVSLPTSEQLAGLAWPATDDPTLVAYLDVPQPIRQQLRPFVESSVQNATSPGVAVQRLLESFKQFTYTTSPPPMADGYVDPVASFVLATKAGHCEYFASSMALSLRIAGVPSRLVNGFLGASYNEVGEFYVVRQADAHAWVEAYLGDELGWVMFDPTPAQAAARYQQEWGVVRQWADAVEQRYLEWIIDYDLSKQVRLLGEVGIGPARERSKSPQDDRAQQRQRWLIGGSLVACYVLYLALRRRKTKRPRHQATKWWLQTQQFLGKYGLGAQPDENDERWLARIALTHPTLQEPLENMLRIYRQLRFGNDTSNMRQAQSDYQQHMRRLAIGMQAIAATRARNVAAPR